MFTTREMHKLTYLSSLFLCKNRFATGASPGTTSSTSSTSSIRNNFGFDRLHRHQKRRSIDVDDSGNVNSEGRRTRRGPGGEIFFPEEFRPSHYLVW